MKYILLGIIQGLTEFLPVSSSAHLVIAQKLLKVPFSIPFDITVHLATLLAVLIYFWKDIVEIARWFLVGLFKIATRNLSLKEVYQRIAFFKLGCLLLIATLITAVIGFSFSNFFESLFSSAKAVGAFLVLTGIILFMAESFPKGKKEIGQLNLWDAILIGLAQAIAIAPGLSRSGTTVSAGLMRGLNRELAARFSFLLAIPAILGAGLFEAKKIAAVPDLMPLILGGIAAFISGYLAIGIFMRIITRYSLRGFAYYCIAIGLIVLILL
jgi:undecaprenyl-diphosphatase